MHAPIARREVGWRVGALVPFFKSRHIFSFLFHLFCSTLARYRIRSPYRTGSGIKHFAGPAPSSIVCCRREAIENSYRYDKAAKRIKVSMCSICCVLFYLSRRKWGRVQEIRYPYIYDRPALVDGHAWTFYRARPCFPLLLAIIWRLMLKTVQLGVLDPKILNTGRKWSSTAK